MDQSKQAQAWINSSKANISAAMHLLTATSVALDGAEQSVAGQLQLADVDKPFVALTDEQVDVLRRILRSYHGQYLLTESEVDAGAEVDQFEQVRAELVNKAEAEHYDRRF
jgi:hypothetical protein